MIENLAVNSVLCMITHIGIYISHKLLNEKSLKLNVHCIYSPSEKISISANLMDELNKHPIKCIL